MLTSHKAALPSHWNLNHTASSYTNIWGDLRPWEPTWDLTKRIQIPGGQPSGWVSLENYLLEAIFTNVGILPHTFVKKDKWGMTFNSRTTNSMKAFCFAHSVGLVLTMPFAEEAYIILLSQYLNEINQQLNKDFYITYNILDKFHK